MSTRPGHNFVPPEAPELEAVTVSSALNKGTGTRSVRDRVRFWAAFALLFLAGWNVPPVALWLLGLAWEGGGPAAIVWEAAGLLIVFVVGAAWLLLTFRQDLAQFHHMLDLWSIQLDGLEATITQSVASRKGWDATWGQGPPPIKHETTIHYTDGIKPDAASRRAQAAANVAQATPPDARTTQHLRLLGQDVAWAGSDEAVIVAALLDRQPVSHRKRPQDLSEAAFKAAVGHLVAAEVLRSQLGRGLTWHPDFAHLATAGPVAHAEAARLCGRAYSPPP